MIEQITFEQVGWCAMTEQGAIVGARHKWLYISVATPKTDGLAEKCTLCARAGMSFDCTGCLLLQSGNQCGKRNSLWDKIDDAQLDIEGALSCDPLADVRHLVTSYRAACWNMFNVLDQLWEEST